MFEYKATSKGHLIGMFRDRYGAECSIQESSYPDEPCIWLGVEVDSGGEGVSNGRMHLNREQAEAMLDALRYFVNEGTLGEYSQDDFGVGAWVRGISKDNYGVRGRVVEVRGETVTIQDQARQGESGRITCLWSQVKKLWEPGDAPQEGRPLWDHLEDF